MKKTLLLLLSTTLVGCGSTYKTIEGPSPGVNFKRQLNAPFPWVKVIPSERALTLKSVDFGHIAEQIRFNLSFFFDKNKQYRDVTLILVDYSTLPTQIHRKASGEFNYKYQTYTKHVETLPERYFLRMSFYRCHKRPPAAPDFEEEVTMPVTKCHPQEAIFYMTQEIFMDHTVSHLKQIEVQLD